MRVGLLLGVLLLLPAPALAQVPPTGDLIVWDQPGPDLATVLSLVYAYTLDGSGLVALTSVQCVGTWPPFACQAPFPTPGLPDLAGGTHALTLAAVNASQVNSGPSTPPTLFTVTGTAPPPPPSPPPCVPKGKSGKCK